MNKKDVLEKAALDLHEDFSPIGASQAIDLVMPDAKNCGDCASRVSDKNLSADEWERIVEKCGDCAEFKAANGIKGNVPGQKSALLLKVKNSGKKEPVKTDKNKNIKESVQSGLDEDFGHGDGKYHPDAKTARKMDDIAECRTKLGKAISRADELLKGSGAAPASIPASKSGGGVADLIESTRTYEVPVPEGFEENYRAAFGIKA